MAIDYGIAYDCPPKRLMGAEGILERVKSRAHAETVIALYREGGDQRPPTEMEFEMTRTNLEGVEESRVINVQGLLDFAAQLNPLARHCEGCPANVTGKPFGCYGAVQYPISAAAERWLLDSLPGIAEPLIWLLLRQGVQELGYDGASVAPLRADPTYFEEHRLPGRDLTEFIFTGNQMFEMLFLVGAIQPSHAGMLLLLLGAIRREIEADIEYAATVMAGFTRNERELVNRLLSGQSVEKIAIDLGLPPATIIAKRDLTMRQLGANGFATLTRAVARGFKIHTL